MKMYQHVSPWEDDNSVYQYFWFLLIRWYWLFSTNLFNILRLFTGFHLFTLVHFWGLIDQSKIICEIHRLQMLWAGYCLYMHFYALPNAYIALFSNISFSVLLLKSHVLLSFIFVLFRLKYYGFTKILLVERYRFCRAKFGWHISMFSSINELQILELSFLHIYVFQSKVQPACISLINKGFFLNLLTIYNTYMYVCHVKFA